MHAGRIYALRDVMAWTRREALVFLVISAIPTILYAGLGQSWLGLPWLPIAMLGTAVAFITGFKNSASYDRMWEARKIWGGIINCSRRWAFGILDFATTEGDDGKELAAAQRRILHRHIAWLAALRHQLRQSRSWESGKQSDLEFRCNNYRVPEEERTLEADWAGLLGESEREAVARRTNPAAHLLRNQSGDLLTLYRRGWIEDFRHMELQNLLGELVDCQGKSERIKNFPYPRQFATLNYIFVSLFIALVPLGLLPEFAELGPGFAWLTIPFSALVAWIFHTLDRIGSVSENPFEGSPNDVPITALSRNIEIDLREMLGETDVPAPLQPVNDILM